MYEKNDIDWTWDGDIILGQDGDFQDTHRDPFLSLRTEITTVIRSEIKDWSEHPQTGAGLSKFVGSPNDKRTAQRIEHAVKSALVYNGNIQASDIDISVVPITVHSILLVITVVVESVPSSEYAENGTITVAVAYDTVEDTVIFYDKSMTTRQGK